MQHIFLKGIVTVLLLLLVTSLAWGAASVPNLINFQGRLTDASGNPVADVSHTVNFTLWTLPSGGANVWTENTSKTTSGGIFTHQLGSTVGFSLPPSLFQTYDSLYLQIQADGQIILPRIRLTSTPYTRLADNLEVRSTFLSTPSVVVASDPYLNLLRVYGDDETENARLGGPLYGQVALFDEDVANDLTATLTANSSSGGELILGNDAGTPTIDLHGGLTGDASVILPASAINAAEMLNEPGIARSNFTSFTSIANSGVTNISSRSITIPGPGYIVAQAYAYGQIQGTPIGNIIFGIDEISTSTGSQWMAFGANNEAVVSGTYRWGALSTERTFFKSGAGTYPFYLNASRGFTGGAAEVWYSRFVLTYYPTSYGIVSSLVAESEAPEYSNPTTAEILQNPASGNQPTAMLYHVDLRELELKVAKAEAEAEKAKRELMEAKLKQQLENRVQKIEQE